MTAHARPHPASSAATNGSTDAGLMPANVLLSSRAIVTAGFAKLVDDVKKYAPAMYAQTANGTTVDLPLRTAPKITSRRPKVAMTSPSQSPGLDRECVESVITGSENIRFAA